MKQLKIIASSYDSQVSVSQASFNESITIAPNSRIWLDKVSMNILSTGGNGDIIIQGQTITFNPDRTNSQTTTALFRSFVIPAGSYALSDLLAVIQDGFNSNLYSSIAFDSGNRTPDLGIGFLVSSSVASKGQTVSIAFVAATCETRNDPITVNIDLNGDNWLILDQTQPASVNYTTTPLLKGALLVNTSIAVDGGNYTDNEISLGLFPAVQGATQDSDLQYGLRYDGTTSLWYIVNGPSEVPITASALLNNDTNNAGWPNKRFTFFIDPADFASNGLRFAVVDAVSHAIIYQTPLGAFAGYTTDENWYYGIFTTPSLTNNTIIFKDPFITYQPNVLNDNVGTYIDFPSIGTKTYVGIIPNPVSAFPVFPYINPPVRNVVIKFVDSQQLGFGLGFGTSTLPTIVGVSGIITAPNPVNFINFVDLAMDILNLPLQTYISARSSTSGTTGRTNTLAFFTPQPQNSSSTSLYSFENKNVTFIDIGNKDPLVIESLQYRIYNPLDLNSFFVFSNLSINMFISEPSEGGDVRIASA
jgi:hypothetical protein